VGLTGDLGRAGFDCLGLAGFLFNVGDPAWGFVAFSEGGYFVRNAILGECGRAQPRFTP